MEPPTWVWLEVQKRQPSPAALRGAEHKSPAGRARAPAQHPDKRSGESVPGGLTDRELGRTSSFDPEVLSSETLFCSAGAMVCPPHLRRAACLLSLCLLTRCRLQVAATPLPLGEEARPGEALPKSSSLPPGEPQETGPGSARQRGEAAEDLFQDVDPKALAAVLLQALQPEPEKSSELHGASPEPDANEERVLSKSEGPEVQPEAQRSWAAGREERQPLQEEQPEAAAGTSRRQEEVAGLKSVLRELQSYSLAAKREEPARDSGAAGSPRDEVLQELEEYERLKVHTKRRAPASEPWAGARKLRQQQHLEHQLLQRRYEELAESRRQAEEARRAAAEEERLADMASDLLLQYLLKDGEEEDEEESDEEGEEEGEGPEQGRPGAGHGPGGSEEVSRKGSPLLFEDEEAGNVAEDKRSNEAPEEEEEEEEEDDIDPNTIDRLIELSSKLHLPADDVIDIINDVEKKKKEMPEPRSGKSSKAGGPATRSKAKKMPPYNPAYHPAPRPLPKPYYTSTYKPYSPRLPKQDEASWNEVLKGEEYPPPKWSRAQPSPKISNAISPWTFQSPASHPYRRLPGPVVVPRDEYYEGNRVRDEELENYLESVLMKHPKIFP
nr:neurosecretory protein VGF [Pogona vitticeps]